MKTTVSHKPSGAKDFFLHLLTIVTLYGSVISLIALLFQYVNYLLPDVLDYSRYGILDGIKWSTAYLVIMFPVFLFTSWLINKDLSLHEEKAEYRIRKWLLYLTLFIAAVTVIGDLVALVYRLLDGDITLRFALKVLIVLGVAGSMFGYYFWDVRRTDFESGFIARVAGLLASVVVIASIVAGFFLIGSPADQRRARLDERRTNDLSQIQNQIVYYWTNKAQLPATLQDLENPLEGYASPVDPETGKSYEYSIVSPLTFKLCADFATVSVPSSQTPALPISRDLYSQNWAHAKGNVCFERTIDPELYKPVGKPQPLMQMQ
ncbi:MAG: type II secretion system protein [Candidatus Peribacteraceae bacterium]|nr:type II secretion system protein [Candidatus Peribacteraceae bacterium]